MLWSKGGKVVYSGKEAGEMVCMNSDSEGDDLDLAEELVSLDWDSDWEGVDEDIQNSEDNNTEGDQEQIDKSSPSKKDWNSSMSLSHQKCLKLCVRKMLVKYKWFIKNYL